MFEIDPDIRKARTLPSDFYTDPRYLELSKERIFARTWHFVGRVDDEHTLSPKTILPGFMDEHVIVVNTGGSLSCLSNVCTHRGMLLVDDPCRADLIRCRYHGRRFGLDGRCISMPEFEDVEGFPSHNDDLTTLPLAERGGFMFAAIDPIQPFDALIDDLASHVAGIDTSGLRLTSSRVYCVKAHWALYCENYLEGFHIPFVHHGLTEVVDYGSYTTETFRYSSVQTGFGIEGDIAARYIFVFPNMMFNFYPWGLSVNVVRPIGAAETEIDFFTYVRDGMTIDGGAGADLHSVELEDEAVVESVQKGIRSRFYSSGRYSPTREQGTHHFHRLLAEFMS